MGKDKKVILGFLGIGAVLIVLIGYFGIYQTYKKMGVTKGKIKDQKAVVDIYKEKAARIPELQKRKAEIEEVVEKFAKILPNDATEENYKLLTTFENYMAETQTEVRDFRPVKKDRKPGTAEPTAFKRAEFQLEIEGHFFDVARLMNLIERTEKFLKIDSFNCKRMQQGGEAEVDLTLLVCTVKLSTYTYDPPRQPPATKP